MKKILFVLITLLLTLNIFSQTQVRILGKDTDGNNKFVLTNGGGELVVIDITHHEIHEGCHFYYTNNSTIGSGDSVKYLFLTPHDTITTRKAHLLFDISGSGITQVRIYESAGDNGTTLQSVFNNNRNSSATAYSKIYLGTTATGSVGTLIYNNKGGSSSGAFRAAGLSRAESEIILKPNTKYKVLINSTTADNIISVIFRWYEEDVN